MDAARPGTAVARRMCALHLAFGLAALAAFLVSGAYLHFVAHPSELPDGLHALFVSRHIYILAVALVNLVLAAYVAPLRTRATRTVQWVASGLLAISTLLLIAAFLVEPLSTHSRTPVSSFGLYTLFAGGLLHSAAAWTSRNARL